ncbi:MAG TPA: hypothetical protein VLE53_04925 [Gemmatimonadaceae bacterium]|nr:hypothetical protein [Gemmatimonadaceae bacterium]
MGWMQKIFKTRAENWILHKLAPAQIKSPLSGAPQALEPDRHYLIVRLLSMRVVNVRAGIRRFHAAVHSYARLPHPDGSGAAEFNTLVAPKQLQDVDAERIDRVVQVNQTLFGPVPFRGGPLELEVGLFSIKSGDLTAPYLSLLESLSKTAGVSFVTQALPFAEPLKAGIDLLTGSTDDSILEIGFAAEQWEPTTGVWVSMRATTPPIVLSELTVAGDDFRLYHRGEEIRDKPYMLIEVAGDTRRPAFFEIPDLRQTHAALRAAIRQGKVEAVHDALAVFRRTAYTSGDLLFDDAKNLVARTTAEVDEMLSAPASVRGFRGDGADNGLDLTPLELIPLYP